MSGRKVDGTPKVKDRERGAEGERVGKIQTGRKSERDV